MLERILLLEILHALVKIFKALEDRSAEFIQSAGCLGEQRCRPKSALFFSVFRIASGRFPPLEIYWAQSLFCHAKVLCFSTIYSARLLPVDFFCFKTFEQLFGILGCLYEIDLSNPFSLIALSNEIDNRTQKRVSEAQIVSSYTSFEHHRD
ncbi:hypothetical protein SAMN04488060_1309 [Qipengyuania nanhaisediminis]|uniref:Uncharacterized protein n=1 Tax=Qipengyuania nanhaisediminis TaxID=604088 RepID=A0A1I5ME03_9SPHN|nr:hypothetical protein SAMN04488060_1309 [Qipengyuania nanhaisediminis]